MTTTTSKYQIYPDFFENKEDCEKFKFRQRNQTNTRYKHFCQTHFTAGDEEQFEEYRFSKNNNNNNNISTTGSVSKIWDKYCNIDGSSVLNTFKYIFYKFKKGIFVKIVNNQLKVFLPFSNSNFINEWGDQFDTSNIQELYEYLCKIEGRKYNSKNVNSNINSWYSNNYLLRYEYPIKESDTNVCVLKNMIEELCSNRNIPDIEFFINRRDFPLHTTDSSEPYFDIWNSENTPLKSHNYEKYSPILSMCKNDKFEDILMPTHEDWSRVQSFENKWFPYSSRSTFDNSDDIILDWDRKKPIALFRGSSTGKGITIENNMRLKVSYMSSSLNLKDPIDNLNYLDAGITKWNVRPRKLSNNQKLQTINVESLPFGLSNYLSLTEQSEYKYIIHIDGHVSAFRLSLELSMKSVVLLVESEWEIWYSNKLKPYIHYVPIKKDLSDLIDQIKWCKNNDEKCKNIAKNAFDFYNNFLNKNAILDYFQKTLVNLKANIGEYFYFEKNYKDILNITEYNIINNFQISLIRRRKKINYSTIEITEQRFYGLLKAIQILFSTYKKKLIVSDKTLIYKSKSVTIEKFKIGNFYLCEKNPIDEKKEKENTHEAFIGIFCINEILKEIPNFSFTIGIYENKKIVNEYIENSISLFDYIKSPKFEFKTYIFIILQLCLSLQVGQNKFNFVHYDLTPWNILLQEFKDEISIDYKVECNKCYNIQTKIVPIIIDYGKSYCSIKKHHHGYVKMFKFSTSQDILSILITSIYEIICHQHLSNIDFHNLIKLSNFLSENNFRKEKFKNSKELKSFLLYKKKYSILINGDKYELENKTPMDLFNYINNNLYIYKYLIYQKSPKNFKSIMMKCDEDLFYNLLLNNKISNAYFEKRINQIIKDDVDSLNCILSNYMCFLGMERTKFYRKIKRKLPNARKYIIHNKFSSENIIDNNISYEENDFLSISKIKLIQNKIKNNEEDNIDPIFYKDIITKRKNSTNIYDFEYIIQKISNMNQKFIEL